jgi:Peptidase family M28
MDTSTSIPAQFAEHALAFARLVGKNGRGSATSAERQAAEYVKGQLNSMGIQEVKLQPFLGERSLWLFIALAFGLALVGHAAYWLLQVPLGALPAMLIAWLAFGFSGYLVWCKFTRDDYPLKHALPHAPSQNVIAVIPPAQQAQKKLVLIAHLDSHRAVFWFATDFMVRIFSPIAAACLFGIFLAIPVYGLAALTRWPALSWLGIVLLVLHFIGWFTGVTADLGQYSPGANDNASAVGTVLALAERIKSQPLVNTEIWLAFTGCEETSGDGMLSFLKEYGPTIKDALFLDFEMVGIGDSVSYLRQEGNMRPLTIPPDVETFIKDVGQKHGLLLTQAPLVGGATECSILWRRGYKAVCLLAHRKGANLLPEWHRLTDTVDHLQVSSLERVHGLAWDILQSFDLG